MSSNESNISLIWSDPDTLTNQIPPPNWLLEKFSNLNASNFWLGCELNWYERAKLSDVLGVLNDAVNTLKYLFI